MNRTRSAARGSREPEARSDAEIFEQTVQGAWHEQKDELAFVGLGHPGTSEVAAVLEHTTRRIEKHRRRRGVLPGNEDEMDPPPYGTSRVLRPDSPR